MIHSAHPPQFSASKGRFNVLQAEFTRKVLEAVIRRTGSDTAAIARELGVSRRTVYNLLKSYKIEIG